MINNFSSYRAAILKMMLNKNPYKYCKLLYLCIRYLHSKLYENWCTHWAVTALHLDRQTDEVPNAWCNNRTSIRSVKMSHCLFLDLLRYFMRNSPYKSHTLIEMSKYVFWFSTIKPFILADFRLCYLFVKTSRKLKKKYYAVYFGLNYYYRSYLYEGHHVKISYYVCVNRLVWLLGNR